MAAGGMSLLELSEEVRQEFERETADREADLLVNWCRAFEFVFQEKPEILPHPYAGCGDRRMTVVRIPPIFLEPGQLGSTGHFQRHPSLVTHMRRMGYDWTDAGHVIQAPSPATLNALLPRFGFGDAGYRTCLTLADDVRMSLGQWLLLYLDGIIPIQVASPGWYDRLKPRFHSRFARRYLTLLDPTRNPTIRNHFLFLPHDLTLHAQNYHLVPRAALCLIKSIVYAELPERVAQWREPGAMAPLTLTFFFDNDFNKYTYAIWCKCEAPEEFGSLFLEPRYFEQLKAALMLRLSETRQRKGDIASGRTEEMPPLEPVSYHL